VDIRPLQVPDSYVLDLVPHGDPRGRFTEWYRADVLSEAVGHPLPLAQANHSVSARGVLRGVHFALVPPGQAKYVYCPAGRVLDVVVDVRVGSPTFGVSDAVLLDSDSPRAVYLAEGLGHAFLSLADGSNITYLVSSGYAPDREFGVSPPSPRPGSEGCCRRWSSASPATPNSAPQRSDGSVRTLVRGDLFLDTLLPVGKGDRVLAACGIRTVVRSGGDAARGRRQWTTCTFPSWLSAAAWWG
jgi:dTDP-4-dehydrorhamnose 3,5-epimerase